MTDLQAIMPRRDQIPAGWKRWDSSWWSLYRGERRRLHGNRDIQMDAHVYLNSHGREHELRFLVWDHARKGRGLPCQDCRDLIDSLGLRRCERCRGETIRRYPYYGVSSNFCRVPGLRERLLASRQAEGASGYRQVNVDLGDRGLDRPSLADTLCVLGWCDDMLVRIWAGDVVWNDPADAVEVPAFTVGRSNAANAALAAEGK